MPRAPRKCPGNNGNCTNRIRNTRYCPTCTPAHTWAGPRTESSKATSTTHWKNLRRTILDRDNHTCQIKLPGICVGRATHVDKIRAAAAGGQPSTANARAACKPCNEHKGRTTDKHQPTSENTW